MKAQRCCCPFCAAFVRNVLDTGGESLLASEICGVSKIAKRFSVVSWAL
jgi:hypothetical protein